MNKPGSKFKGPNSRHQKGATLIVSLIILAVVTLLGLASMRSSNQQLLMAASARDRAVAFQAAEAALSGVEQQIMSNPFPLSSYMPTCQGDRCFTPDCRNGLCFSGDLENAVNRDDCRLSDPVLGRVVQHWRRSEFWEGEPPTIEVAVSQAGAGGGVQMVPVAHMVEFKCFVPRDDSAVDSEANRNTGVPLYRLTVLARGPAGRSTVTLQSNFKAAQ